MPHPHPASADRAHRTRRIRRIARPGRARRPGRSRRGLAVLGIALLTGAASLLAPSGALVGPPAPAQAAGSQTITAQLTYTCGIAGVPDLSTVGIVFNATAPASVGPGEQVSASGTITLRLPENVRAVAEYVNITEVEGYSDTVTLPATVDGATSVLPADRVIAPRVGVGDPLVVSASLSWSGFVVPEGSSGEIVIEAPANGTVTSPRPDLGPAMVAFTAMATVYSQEGAQTIGLFCWDAVGIDRTLFRIPVTPAADPGVAGAPAETESGAGGAEAAAEQAEAPKVRVERERSGERRSEEKDNASTFRVAAEAAADERAGLGRALLFGGGALALAAGATWLALQRRRIERARSGDETG